MVHCGKTWMERPRVAWVPFPSVTVTTKEAVVPVGVPLKTPAVLIDRPAGRAARGGRAGGGGGGGGGGGAWGGWGGGSGGGGRLLGGGVVGRGWGPGVGGGPGIAPARVLSDGPAGSAPEVTAKVMGALPP